MSDFAVLLTGDAERASAVRLVADGGDLQLWSGDGSVESIPWWRLYRLNEDSTTHRFRRLDRRQWELRVTAGSDRALLAHVGKRPLHRLLHPLRRLESLKVLVGVAVIAFTVAQHAPPEWLASYVPTPARRRLVGNVVAQYAPARCSRKGGEAAIRKLLVRLDPKLGREVEIVAINDGGFVVTSLPAHKIAMFRSSMTEIDAAALPALLAHELSHIRHGDPMAAVIRSNGLMRTLGLILEGSGRQRLTLDFSGLEERRADLEAMQMMRRAGIPLRPAAAMFEQMRVSKAQNGFYGYDYRDFHFGIEARAQRWAAAAASDPPNPKPLLSDGEQDDLYNFCWSGPIAEPKQSPRLPPRAGPPGAGALGRTSTLDKAPSDQ